MKIIHHHIFKNAGTSIDGALKERLGPAFGVFEGNHPHDIKDKTAIQAFFREHPKLIAVSTHLGRPQLPLEQFFPIVFLRHPYLRAKSVYTFTKKDPSQYFHQAALSILVTT